MAIKYVEQALPDVAKINFDITRWSGVNHIKASQTENEMADCKNMSSANYPYASPRMPREAIKEESGIKKICKVDDDCIYYIDSADKYCKYDGTTKTELVTVGNVNNFATYDDFDLFFPNMSYYDNLKGEYKTMDRVIKDFNVMLKDSLTPGELVGNGHYLFEQISDESTVNPEYADFIIQQYYKSPIIQSNAIAIEDISVEKISLKMILPDAVSYSFPHLNDDKYEPKNHESGQPYTMIRGIQIKFYDKNGNMKLFKDGLKDTEFLFTFIEPISTKESTFNFTIPSSLTLEKGDYFIVSIGYFFADLQGHSFEDAYCRNVKYLNTAEWFVTQDTDKKNISVLPLEFATVYNNRVVGVNGSDIRASALGDFANYWEYVDEAGNPSATGAYATDVGSSGRFTGITQYNNVLLLFKKDVVYQMYGSMPYTISELCKTGCIDSNSIVYVNGSVFWASPKGFVKYSGGIPTVISHNVNINTNGVFKACSNGRKIYCYDGKKIFVYDTYYNMWHIEDKLSVSSFCSNITDLYISDDTGILKADSGNERVNWEFETKDFTFNIEERKNLSKLWIRTDMKENSKLEVFVRQDGGEWKRIAVKTAEKDEMFDFKLRIKKCDSFTLKFKGIGDVRILDIHGKVTVGTSKHRSGASLNVYRR